MRKAVRTTTGKIISRAYLHTILTNRFYIGQFSWGEKLYRGTHDTFITPDLYENVQAVLRGHNKPKYRKHEIAFRGLLRCARDNCTITAELKKGKYVYDCCTGHRGKCTTPRFTETEMGEKLSEVLKGIQIPDDVLCALQESLTRDQSRLRDEMRAQRHALECRLAAVRRRMDQAYQDKLDGKLPEPFWERRMVEWNEEEQRIQAALARFQAPAADRTLDAKRILELANKAYSLYLRQNPAEQAELLRMVLLNCSVDGVSVWPTYKKPFDLIFQRAKNEEWSGW